MAIVYYYFDEQWNNNIIKTIAYYKEILVGYRDYWHITKIELGLVLGQDWGY